MNGTPLADVTLEVDGHTTRTDRSGRFLLVLEGLASGRVELLIDGRTTAEALAAALLVAGAPATLAIALFVAALAITLGAVGGRYHYAADAILGWAVALVV